jgi:hypothetical protein
MRCMELAALEQASWSPDFRAYFLEAIAHPARMVLKKAQAAREP